jgi:hypothetical protein
MEIGNIIKGHVNELLGLNKNISEERKKICKKCPLYTIRLGQEICNNKLFMNPETGDISTENKIGYKRGCGCRINAKTTLPYVSCPLNKWQ